MKKISSSLFFYKKILPLFWFGSLAYFVIAGFMYGAFEEEPVALVVPCFIMAAFGFFLMKRVVWDLVDEVYDCGDSLLVKNRGIEERVALANIMNVSSSTNVNPSRITLRLVKPGKLGSEISFSPAAPFTINPFAKIPVAEDLIVRVDKARGQRAPW